MVQYLREHYPQKPHLCVYLDGVSDATHKCFTVTTGKISGGLIAYDRQVYGKKNYNVMITEKSRYQASTVKIVVLITTGENLC